MHLSKTGVLAALATALVAGCGGGHPVATPVAPVTTHPAAIKPKAQVALTHAAVDVFASPHVATNMKGNCQTHTPPCRLSVETPLGSPRVLPVMADHGAWIEVSLPTRPNGTLGWVHSSDVMLDPANTDWIKVNLASHTIQVMLKGKLTTGPAAIGAKATPTPEGVFYVTDRVRNPGPAYGSFALGLSAHSNVLNEFAGHDGQVGIHGTNVPASIGKAVSHGCVRVSPAIDKVLASVPLGTRVTIF